MINSGKQLDKFLASRKEVPDGCIEWTKSRDKQGYGLFYSNGGVTKAHRIAYWIYYHTYPDDKCVCHSCDNPSCVNPEHLFLGTVQDNNKDRHSKGRSKNKPTSGEAHNMAKLSEQQVLSIKQILGATQKELAETYGVSVAQISRIVNGKSWTHL